MCSGGPRSVSRRVFHPVAARGVAAAIEPGNGPFTMIGESSRSSPREAFVRGDRAVP